MRRRDVQHSPAPPWNMRSRKMTTRTAARRSPIWNSEHTQFSTLLDVQYLADEAGKSPIVERRLQTSVVGVLNYRF